MQGQIKDSEDKVIYKDKQDPNDDNSVEESGMEIGEISQQPALDSNGELLSAAALLCETIKQKSDMIVSFDELLCVTPRGRFQVDMHQDFFRLRGRDLLR
jgi:structure-specific recognition protein 1